MHKIIYLDTNIFLHYQPFTQINWPEIVEAESATIVVPPITIRELSGHKDSHPRPQIRKRAGETIKKLSGFLYSGTNAKISEKVSILFEDRDPEIDFSAHHLNFNIQDDQLIASILLNKQETPNEHIVLITSDLGLALVAKAGRQGINTEKMPENFRIPEESDPNENKVRQLEQQIRELSARTPKLSLVHEDGEQHTTIKLRPPLSLEQSEIEKRIDAIKSNFPKRNREGAKDESHSSINALESASLSAAMAMVSQFNAISQEEIDRYNNEVEKYAPAYIKFIEKELKFENLQRRAFKLVIALANDGTTPAEDIDIYLHFPNGFRLLEEHELPNAPQPPAPPEKPMTVTEKFEKSMSLSQIYSPSLFHDLPDISPKLPENVSSPSIKRLNSYEVHVHVQKVKHNLPVSLDSLYVIFDSFENAASFTIEYRILAANIPSEVDGKLHVIIQKGS